MSLSVSGWPLNAGNYYFFPFNSSVKISRGLLLCYRTNIPLQQIKMSRVFFKKKKSLELGLVLVFKIRFSFDLNQSDCET